jgi:hypothetical protein
MNVCNGYWLPQIEGGQRFPKHIRAKSSDDRLRIAKEIREIDTDAMLIHVDVYPDVSLNAVAQ